MDCSRQWATRYKSLVREPFSSQGRSLKVDLSSVDSYTAYVFTSNQSAEWS